MTEAPAPLTAPGCDVRTLKGFMLDTEKLMASELWALSSGDEMKAALALWCRAWKQVPAASLPNDDKVLAAFSGAGSKWTKVRAMALRGFVLCSDGRLYHPVLAADARRAMKALDQRRAAIRKRYGKDNDEEVPEGDADNGGATGQATAVTTNEPTAVGHPTYGEPTIDGTGRDGTEVRKKERVVDVDDGRGRDRAKFDPATERVIEAAGADPTKQAGWMFAASVVSKWLARGADLEMDILPTIGAVAVSRGEKGPPTTPSYYDRAIVDAIETRLRPLPSGAPKVRNVNGKAPAGDVADTETARWKARISGWTKSKFWRQDDWGPPPDDPQCWAPAMLLAELDQRGRAA